MKRLLEKKWSDKMGSPYWKLDEENEMVCFHDEKDGIDFMANVSYTTVIKAYKEVAESRKKKKRLAKAGCVNGK